MKIKLIDVLIIFLLTLLSLFFLLNGLNKPYVGISDLYAVIYGGYVRNWQYLNILESKFALIDHFQYLGTQTDSIYNTYQLPGFSIILYITNFFFGKFDCYLRFVPIFSSVMIVVLIYLLVKYLSNRFIGFISSTIILFTPIFQYYGKSVNVYQVQILFLLAFLLSFIVFWDRKINNLSYWPYFLFSIFISSLGLQFGWWLYFILFSLLIIGYLAEIPSLKFLLFLIPVILFSFGLHVYQIIQILGDNIIGNLFTRFVSITEFPPDLILSNKNFSLWIYLKQQYIFFIKGYTPIIIILSIIAMIVIIRKWWLFDKLNRLEKLIILLFILGSVYQIIFPKTVYIQEFINLSLLPFFAISSGFTINKIFIQLNINKIKQYLLLSSIFLIVGYFGLYTYQKWQVNMQMYNAKLIANQVKILTTVDSNILIQSPDFDHRIIRVISYYADRKIVLGNFPFIFWKHQGGIINRNYRYLLLIDGDLPDQNIVNLLLDNYKHYDFGLGTIFEIGNN